MTRAKSVRAASAALLGLALMAAGSIGTMGQIAAAEEAGKAGALEVRVTNAKPKGLIYVSVVDAEGFAGKKKMLRAGRIDPQTSPLTIRFADLPPGRYAVRLFQDLDANGELKRGMMGIPVEPWGMSNNARARMGPPTWEDAAFDLKADPIVQEIKLK